MKRSIAAILWLCLPVLSGGCLGVDTETAEAVTVVAFDPAPLSPSADEIIMPKVPQPSDLLRDPATGKVSIPLESQLKVRGQKELLTVSNFPTEEYSEFIQSYVNTLYGFVTSSDSATTVVGAGVDETTVTPQTAFVLDVTELMAEVMTAMAEGRQPDLTAVTVALVPEAVVTVGDTQGEAPNAQTVINFGVPKDEAGLTTWEWAQGHTYAAVLTGEIKDLNGKGLESAYLFNMFKSLEPLAENGRTRCALPDRDAAQLEMVRLSFSPLFAWLENVGVDGAKLARKDVAQLWTFTIRPGAIAVNDPTKNLFPTPNDIVMTSPASTSFDCDGDGKADCLEGHLCFPIDCEAGTENANYGFLSYMNSLDGWPASMIPAMNFSLPIEASTITEDGVRVFDLTTGKPISGVTTIWDEASRSLKIVPPAITAGAKFGFVVTNSLMTQGGVYPVAPSDITGITKLTRAVVSAEGKSLLPGLADDANAGALELLRQGADMLLKGMGMDSARQTVAAVWGYTVQSHNEAMYNPVDGILPFPNDVLMAMDEQGNPVNVNIPLPSDPAQAGVVGEINKLDGFSPLGPTRTMFLRPLDPASMVPLTDPLALLDPTLGNAGLAVVGLSPDVDLSSGNLNLLALVTAGQLVVFDQTRIRTSFRNGYLEVSPRAGYPWPQGWRFIVALFDNLRSMDQDGQGNPYPIEIAPIFNMARSAYPLVDENGKSQVIALDDASAAMLEPLRSSYNMFFSALEAPPANLGRERIKLFWTFTTQHVVEWARGLVDQLAGKNVDSYVSLSCVGPTQIPELAASQFIGKVCDDSFFHGFTALSKMDLSNPEAPVLPRLMFTQDGKLDWQAEDRKITVIIPKDTVAGPYKVIIQQHGLRGERQDVFIHADRLAAEGYVTVAMDLPLHGERTEGEVSGDGFFTADPASVRDNIIGSALDLVQVAMLVKGGAFANILENQGVSLDQDQVYFIGSSLGGIVGTMFLGIQDLVNVGALLVTPGHLTKVLTDTPLEEFAKPIQDTLAAMGIEKDSPAYDQFIELAQTILDRGDPVNYASTFAAEDSAKKLFLGFAGDFESDGFMPWDTVRELGCTARRGDYPYFRHYQGACHGFFMHPCEGTEISPQTIEAIEDVIEFLNADGEPAGDTTLLKSMSLDCNFAD